VKINFLNKIHYGKNISLSFLFFTTIFSFTYTAAAQNGEWLWLDPFPNGHRINDIHLFSENRIIVVGENGNILLTEDGGASWVWVDPELKPDLKSVFFIDDNTGWIGGNGGLLKSVDAGNSWSNFDLGFSLGIEDIFFIDSQNGWTVNNALFPAQKIMKTEDGGETWQFQPFPDGLPNATRLYSIFFIDSQTGWATGSGGAIIHTSDGGTSWNIQDSGTTNPLEDIFFIDELTGWAAGNNRLLKTTDGGTTWTEQNFGISGNFESIHFLNANEGWVTGSKLMQTSDGGETWVELARNAPIRPVSSISSGIYFLSPDVGFGFADRSVYKSSNGGANWEFIKNGTGLNFTSISFTNENEGWGVGRAGTRGAVFHTTDGGITWMQQAISNKIRTFNSVQFINNTTGWIAEDSEFIFRTTDGGNTWIETNTGLPGRTRLESLFFIDSQTGWIVGKDLIATGPAQIIIARTTDGGETWTRQDDMSDGRLKSVFFLDSNTGWAVGDRNQINTGQILHTVDGGETWQVQLENVSNLEDIFFADANNGWAVGVNDLLNTNEGGKTWISQNFAAGNLRSVHFTDALNGWVVGGIGTMAYTDDGGSSWNLLPSITNNSLDEVIFLDAGTGWTTGNGALLKFEEGVITSVLNDEGGTKPIDFELGQNYPNPFNPSTVITFNLPDASDVTLTVYNMLGQRITTLINQPMTAGTHRIDFDASNLSSGVYLYRIQAGKFVQTKKLTLIK